MKAIIEYWKWRDRFTSAHIKEQLSRLETLCNGINQIRQFPEDVTDEFKNALRLLQESLDPYFRGYLNQPSYLSLGERSWRSFFYAVNSDVSSLEWLDLYRC